MTTPDERADRWFRRYWSDVPVKVARQSLHYAIVRAEAAIRDARRLSLGAIGPVISWLTARLP